MEYGIIWWLDFGTCSTDVTDRNFTKFRFSKSEIVLMSLVNNTQTKFHLYL